MDSDDISIAAVEGARNVEGFASDESREEDFGIRLAIFVVALVA
jgi:hypothetical protein